MFINRMKCQREFSEWNCTESVDESKLSEFHFDVCHREVFVYTFATCERAVVCVCVCVRFRVYACIQKENMREWTILTAEKTQQSSIRSNVKYEIENPLCSTLKTICASAELVRNSKYACVYQNENE